MNARLKILIYIFAFIALYACYYWLTPLIVNIDSRTEQIQNFFEQRYGLQVEVKEPNLKMALTPAVWVSADEFIVHEDSGTPLTIKNPKLKIRLLPLIFKKINLVYLSGDSPSLQLRFDKDYKFYLGNKLSIDRFKPYISLNKAKILINNYKIVIDDEIQSKKIKLTGNHFQLDDFQINKHIKLSVDSLIKINQKSSVLTANIDFKLPIKENFKHSDLILNTMITNIDLNDFSPYIKKFSDGKILETKGILNIEAKTEEFDTVNRIIEQGVINELSIITDKPETSVIYKDRLTFSSNFDLERNSLILYDLSILAKNVNLRADGKVSKINSKAPKLDLNLDINDSKIKNILDLIPIINSDNSDIDYVALKKRGFDADINSQLNFKGEPTQPEVSGNISLNDCFFAKPLLNIPKAAIKLDYNRNNVVMDINIPTSYSEFISIKDVAELYGDKSFKLQIKSSKSVELSVVQDLLTPLSEVFKFDISQLSHISLLGIGNIDLTIEGNPIEKQLSGLFNFIDTTASIACINSAITGANGQVEFDNNKFIFSTKSAYIDGKPIEIKCESSIDGKFKLDFTANGQNPDFLLNIMKSSECLNNFKSTLNLVDKLSGNADLNVNISGEIAPKDDIKEGKKINANGQIKLYNNAIKLTNLARPINNINGTINFKNNNASLNLGLLLNNSKFNLVGSVSPQLADLTLNSPKLFINDLLNCLPNQETEKLDYIPNLANPSISLEAKYTGKSKIFEVNKLVVKGKLNKHDIESDKLLFTSGNFEMKDAVLYLQHIAGYFENNPFDIDATISNVLMNNQSINGKFFAKGFDISTLDKIASLPFFNEEFKKSIGNLGKLNGRIDLRSTVKNNIFNTKFDINEINAVYLPLNMPIKLLSGSVTLSNDELMLYKVNSMLGSMPVLIDGSIRKVFTKPKFNLYLNVKPNQDFVDKYFNLNSIYPIKFKGDIIASLRFLGVKEDYDAKAEIELQKDSNIYYMGATIGDAISPIRLYLNSNIAGNKIDIKNFKYDKLITSLDNKSYVTNQLMASGIAEFSADKLNLYNFKIKTTNPTDARIFNILLRKPNIKQGQFESDITINGIFPAAKMNGRINFTGINIPLYDTIINDISLKFSNNDININSTADIYENRLVLSANVKNKLTPPYEINNIDIYCGYLDLNAILSGINNIALNEDAYAINKSEKPEFDFSSLIIKKAHLKADTLEFKKALAKNLTTDLSLSDKMILSFEDYKFDLAEGIVSGNFKYNLLNSKTDFNLNALNVNANVLTEALFDLESQIYGTLTGETELTCNGKTHKACMETLSGNGNFNVINGKMPKLGSLEYLLKASNLVKSGITGISLNSLIDLVTPLQTGDFDSIQGDFNITSGKADSIQIFTQGKDLSLFITGKYNFATLIADLEIFGRLSKKITNNLGPIGNLSLNTLFNTIPGVDLDEANKSQVMKNIDKIPGLELSDKVYRLFTVKVYGDINGDDYVQSFKWVE